MDEAIDGVALTTACLGSGEVVGVSRVTPR